MIRVPHPTDLLGDGPGPEALIWLSVSCGDHHVGSSDNAQLVPPSPGGTNATLHTGVSLTLGESDLGELGLDIPFEALAEWVDAVRAARRAVA